MSKKKKQPRKHVHPPKGGPHPEDSTIEAIVARANIHDEVRYICDLAARGESRVVGLQSLVFFATSSRDAWMLDWDDELALCLMKDGVLQPVQFGETDERFAIRWEGHYQIEDASFIYIDDNDETRSAVIECYPVKTLENTIDRLRRHSTS